MKLSMIVIASAAVSLLWYAPSALAQSSSTASPVLAIEYAYDAPSDPNLSEIHAQLTSRNVLERLASFLSPLRLPRGLFLRATECGNGETRRAHVTGKTLVFCYEYLKRVERLAISANQRNPQSQRDVREVLSTGATVHALLHLVALAVFEQLEIPVWGNREDAADRLASYLLVQIDPIKAKDWFVGAGMYFALSSAEQPADFTSLTLPDSQRLFDHICFARFFGEDSFNKLVGVAAGRLFEPEDAEKLTRLFLAFSLPDRESQMKAVEGLDPSDKIFQSVFYRRMRLCPQELDEIASAFKQTVAPHIHKEGQKR